MNISDLIEKLEEMRDESLDYLKDNHKKKLPNNTYRCGMEDGAAATCQYLLDFISNQGNENANK